MQLSQGPRPTCEVLSIEESPSLRSVIFSALAIDFGPVGDRGEAKYLAACHVAEATEIGLGRVPDRSRAEVSDSGCDCDSCGVRPRAVLSCARASGFGYGARAAD